jgi:hypothetical protein
MGARVRAPGSVHEHTHKADTPICVSKITVHAHQDFF